MPWFCPPWPNPGVEEERVVASILIVDDERDVHYSFRRMLKQEADLEILSAHSGEEALTYLEHSAGVDLIIMDIRMGGLNGLETLRRIQSTTVQGKPLVITG